MAEEARDDERTEVARIIGGAVYGEPDNLSRATEAADAALSLLAARGYRKHPKPEITDAEVARLHGVIGAVRKAWWSATEYNDAGNVVYTDSVEAAMDSIWAAIAEETLGVPVGEGEQPAPKATLVDERDPACVAEWPECGSGEYDPRCCRFPKSCSAGIIRLVTPGGGEQ